MSQPTIMQSGLFLALRDRLTQNAIVVAWFIYQASTARDARARDDAVIT
jgi:hypothetical protein